MKKLDKNEILRRYGLNKLSPKHLSARRETAFNHMHDERLNEAQKAHWTFIALLCTMKMREKDRSHKIDRC